MRAFVSAAGFAFVSLSYATRPLRVAPAAHGEEL